MRDLVIMLAIASGAVAVGIVGDGENWLGDRIGLLVIVYLAAALFLLGVWADIRSARRKRR